jgi:hypothetical protein
MSGKRSSLVWAAAICTVNKHNAKKMVEKGRRETSFGQCKAKTSTN